MKLTHWHVVLQKKLAYSIRQITLRKMKIKCFAAVLFGVLVSCQPAHAADAKFCGVVVHDISTGKLHRNTAEVARYLKNNPKPLGEEADWDVDHIYSLACGGCDTETNMVLMHKSIKSCARTPTGPYCKDRYERRKDLFCSKPVIHIYVP